MPNDCICGNPAKPEILYIMQSDDLNEIYYQTMPIEANATTIARVKTFSLGLLYLTWLCESQSALDKELPNNLDPMAIFGEFFFDELNEEVKEKTIQGLRNLADALKYRDSN